MNNKTALKQHVTLHFIFGPVITLFLFVVSLTQDPFFLKMHFGESLSTGCQTVTKLCFTLRRSNIAFIFLFLSSFF